jgi:hypothetical protein
MAKPQALKALFLVPSTVSTAILISSGPFVRTRTPTAIANSRYTTHLIAPSRQSGNTQLGCLATARFDDMTRRLLPLAARFSAIPLALLLLWPADASAQYGRTFRTTIKLTSSDLLIIRKIVREDFSTKPNGTTLPWSNPESQNSGTVTLLNRFSSEGRDCRRVRYLVNPGPQQPPAVISATYVLTSCRLADGSWKLDNAAQPDASR